MATRVSQSAAEVEYKNNAKTIVTLAAAEVEYKKTAKTIVSLVAAMVEYIPPAVSSSTPDVFVQCMS